MATMRDIKRRIKSVRSIRQITRAMKMVAAAKLRRSQERMMGMRPYSAELERLMLLTLPQIELLQHPLLEEQESVTKVGALIISSDRGLCGGFNSNLARKFNAFAREHKGKEISAITVGKKITRHARKAANLLDSYAGIFDEMTYMTAYKISERLNRHFMDGELHEVYLIYNQFKSMMTQELAVRKLLPLDIVSLKSRVPVEKRTDDSASFEIEPEGMEFANAILPRYLSTMVYQALLESYASELAARMTAMENATKNAEEMIFDLNLSFNKARQAAITREITEIVGGAEALKG